MSTTTSPLEIGVHDMADNSHTRPRSVQEALAAMQASRTVLRAELIPVSEQTRHAGNGKASAWERSWRRWRRIGSRWPMVAAAGEAAQHWWRSHPWHDTGSLVSEGFQQHAVPMVRRHPWAALGLAAGLGAVLVAARPWHWPLVGHQLQATPRRLGRWALQQLASAPMQAALASLLWMAVQRTDAGTPNAASAEPAPADPAAGQQAQPPLQAV